MLRQPPPRSPLPAGAMPSRARTVPGAPARTPAPVVAAGPRAPAPATPREGGLSRGAPTSAAPWPSPAPSPAPSPPRSRLARGAREALSRDPPTTPRASRDGRPWRTLASRAPPGASPPPTSSPAPRRRPRGRRNPAKPSCSAVAAPSQAPKGAGAETQPPTQASLARFSASAPPSPRAGLPRSSASRAKASL